MKKYILLAMGLFLLIAAGTCFYWYKGKSETANIDEKQNFTQADQNKAQTELEKSFESKTPKGDMPDYENMSEKKLMNEVHGMTHQKVKADKKWGSSEIKKDKVERLYEVIKNKKFEDENIRTMLLGILEPWTRGDFSHAVRDHNRIWKFQDGNVGKASRLLTPAEEKKYIEKTFRR